MDYSGFLGSGLLDMTPKRQTTKEKLDKLDLIKIKNFCASKNTIKKTLYKDN